MKGRGRRRRKAGGRLQRLLFSFVAGWFCLWGKVAIACFRDIKFDLGMFKIIGKMHFPLTSLGAACRFLQADGMMYIKLSLMSGGLF